MSSSTYNEALRIKVEEELEDVGKRLVKLPSSTDELLALLEKAENVLVHVWQQPPKTTGEALSPTMKALDTDELLRHTDLNIQLVFASCMNEITRITAPDAPYNDDRMKEIFQLFMVALKQLSHGTGTNYIRARRILEAMARLRTCLILLDLECDAMVVEIFQLLFSIVKSNHSSDVFKYIETVMTLMIEESDDISPELLRSLLDNVQVDNKNVSPASWELGNVVVGKCARRLQPHLREAVKSMNLNIDNFAEIISSLCKDASSGDNMVAKEVAATVQSVTVGLSSDEASKLDGVCKPEQEDCTPEVKEENRNILDDENSLETLKCCEQIVQLKNNDARPQTEVVKNAETGQQSDTDKGAVRRRRGRKPNSLIRPEEGYEHTWPIGGKDSYKVSGACDKKEKDLSLPLEHGKANMPSDSSGKELDSFNEGSIRKRGQSKKKEGTVNQQSDQELSSKPRRKILQSKLKEKSSVTEKKPTKRVVVGSSDVSVEQGKGSLCGTDSEGKDMQLPQEHSGRREISDGVSSQKQEKKDVVDKMVESPASKSAKDKYPGNLAPETEKKSRRSCADCGEELVNSRIMVWWPMDKTFYTGTVMAFDPLTKKHKIIYDDDEQEVLNLKNERWELFNDQQPRQVQSSHKIEADHSSPPANSSRTQKKTTKRRNCSSKSQVTSSSKRSKSEDRSGDCMNNESDDETSETYFS